jgi:hypothetical protein
MKSARIILSLAVLASVAGLAYVAQQAETPGAQMVAAAQTFLGTLKGEQKTQAMFTFESKERTNWNFIPLQDKEKKSTRKGLPLEEMTGEQKKAALALVKAATSDYGNLAATTIMSLESILREQEKKGAMVRNPEWYFFTVFGTPGKTGSWGWRVEGHHLSLNFAMDGSQVISSTPTFFGANPAEVKSGPDKGKRILASSEDLAIKLFNSLDDEQKKIAHQEKAFPEPGQKTLVPNLGPPVGVAGAKMTEAQKTILWSLLKAYAERLHPQIAETELKLVKDGGLDKVHFAFTGSSELGKGHTYRIHGPSVVVEFLNIQADSGGNPNNHIHSNWRHIKGDFGL